MRSAGTVRALRSAFCQPAPVRFLLLVVLLAPVFSGCLATPLQETDLYRKAGASLEAGEPGPVPAIDWRHVPSNDRRDGSPYGVHLSWLEEPETTLTVTWFTAGLDDVVPVVHWGAEADLLDWTRKAASHKAFDADVSVHVATLRGLGPASWVHYQVCGTTGCSEVFDARTAPPAGSAFRFGLIADQGTTNASLNATGTLLALRPDLVVFAGDTAYADGDADVWDDYFHMHEPLFARVPIMAAPGNHEYKDGRFYEAYRTRFALPNEGLWYGLTISDVHFTFLEFYHKSIRAGHFKDQLEFFRADLEEAQERKGSGDLSFHFVVQHYPLYGNHHKRGDYDFNVNLQDQLLLDNEVDLLLVGHDHFYQRSHPMKNGIPTATGTNHYVDPEGYIQVTSGGGGRGLGTPVAEDLQGAWTASSERRHQIMEFQVDDGRVEGSSWATDGSGDLLDRFSVTRTGLP